MIVFWYHPRWSEWKSFFPPMEKHKSKQSHKMVSVEDRELILWHKRHYKFVLKRLYFKIGRNYRRSCVQTWHFYLWKDLSCKCSHTLKLWKEKSLWRFHFIKGQTYKRLSPIKDWTCRTLWLLKIEPIMGWTYKGWIYERPNLYKGKLLKG
jgi:hypothetical protein